MLSCIAVLLIIVAGLITTSFTIESDKKVKVSTFFEALCLDSKNFVNYQLYPTYSELKDIMEVDANAYGKAKSVRSGSGYSFECQHGTKECQRNMFMACAKKYLQEEEYLHYVHCIMEGEDGDQCAVKVRMSLDLLGSCSTSEEGQNLLYEIGLRQKKIAPDLDYVPWVLVNDHDSKEKRHLARHNLKQVVCDNYEGPSHPACLMYRNITE